jgi:23S rRNA pseudouridine1911/1915/1917 synthase
MIPMPITVSSVNEPTEQRLDSYISSIHQNISRSKAQMLIRTGRILVNNKLVNVSSKLRQGDQITIDIPNPIPTEVIPEKLPITIIYENEHVLVVDKPPHMPVHPAPGHAKGTLANALISQYPELRNIGERLRPGLVHRLDADTSGLMVISKTLEAYENLSHQMKARTITKVYFALVKGHPKPMRGIIEAPLGRDPRHRQRMAIVANGRDASTQYTTIERLNGFALLEVKPRTGRTHQIRVHLAAIGHPVAGDAKYGGRSALLKRQFLHAHRLGFQMPSTGTYSEFVSPLPADLKTVLSIITPI